MSVSKQQAMADSLAHQIDQLLAALAAARGRLEVVAYIAGDLISDQVTSKALDELTGKMSDGIDQAGNAAHLALERTQHIQKALRS